MIGRFSPLAALTAKIRNPPRFYSTFQDFSNHALAEYKKDPEGIDKVIENIINENKFVLFLHGTVDKPLSLCAMNIVKILTALQVVPIVTIDILAEPACYGYLSMKLNRIPSSILVANRKIVGNHDEVLELFKSGKLLQILNHKPKPTGDSPLESQYLPISTI